jgi:uncharacterized protein
MFIIFLGIHNIPADPKKAFEMLSRLANEDHAGAQYLLGHELMQYNQVETGLRWLQKASGNGHRQADMQLGHLYYTGELIEKDMDKAFRHFTRASDKGCLS